MDERPVTGAGGTRGGVGPFLFGAAMTVAGGYLLLTSLQVNGFGGGLFGFGGFRVTGGMIMIPFIIGVGVIFYDSSKWYGWALAGGSLLALIVGAIASVRFSFDGMSAFELIVVLILLFGGIGLVLGSVRESTP